MQTSLRLRAVRDEGPAKILVIDDDPSIVDSLVTCLREEGHEVCGALTIDEGLRFSVPFRPDLVLLEIALSEMGRIDVFERLRSINPRVQVIVVSGNTDPVVARAALQSGAFAYVDKPFDLAYLKRVVAMALRAVGDLGR